MSLLLPLSLLLLYLLFIISCQFYDAPQQINDVYNLLSPLPKHQTHSLGTT